MSQMLREGTGQLQAGSGARLGVPKAQAGSLADAFSELNNEVNAMEEACKRLFERATPFLEPIGPAAGQALAGAPSSPQSPLAQAVGEYIGRVRNVRCSLNELADRISC